jgi:ribonuclease Z
MKRNLMLAFIGGVASTVALAAATIVATAPQEAKAAAWPPEIANDSKVFFAGGPNMSDRDMYFPGTEKLGADEMRVIACGTGMPNQRPKQAAACWLVELGNGEKFLFDIGTGSSERISALRIPYDSLDKVFIGHLHSDHFGDIDALWIGGVVAGRINKLRVWGPDAPREEWSTAYALDLLQKMYQWDLATRSGVIDGRGLEMEVNQFDRLGINAVIYEENGVVIRTVPAIHGTDGPVSFILEWNGLKFAFSSDTYPNKWWIEHTQGADLSIHECFLPPNILVERFKFAPIEALQVGTQGHTAPGQFAKVMALTEPRMAVGYHFFNDFDTAPEILRQVRMVYDGPLALAEDYMVFNVTKDDIRVRMAVVDEAAWPPGAIQEKNPPDFSQAVPPSDFLRSGAEPFPEIVQRYYDAINQMYGTDHKPAY